MGAERWTPRWLVAGAAWLAAVIFGFTVLWRYAAAPGEASRAPAAWPSDTALHRASDRPTLLMFVHPQCPCSRASLADLRRLLQRTGGAVAATVVFAEPSGAPDPWRHGELHELAARIPGVALADDEGEREAHRFGAATSGASLLYDRDGRLAFAGGLTQVRGHEGDSFAEERLATLIRGGHADRADSPVFGCPLDEHNEGAR